MRKFGALPIMILLVLSSCSGNSQSDFEKYYNRRSDYFNNMPENMQNGAEGLAVLREIEATFDRLPTDQKKKFLKRMGDTYLTVSEIYAVQNNTENALAYLQKSADAGFKDPKFIARVKEFNGLRDHPTFIKIIDQMENGSAVPRVDLANVKIPANQLKKDLAVLKESLEEAHQGLYQYLTKENVDDLFLKAESSINSEMTSLEFYNIIAPLVASIKDGHTRVLVPDAPWTLKNRLPIGFTVIDNRIYVDKVYYPDEKKYMGAELQSINKLASSDILAYAMTHFSSDGDNITSKTYRFKNPSWFSDMVMILSGRTEKFDLVLKGEKEIGVKNITVDGITKDSLNALLSINSLPPAELKVIDESSTAILTIRTFAARKFKEYGINFSEFLQSGFASVKNKGIENLIVDVRGNGGGEDAFGRILFSYFVQKEFDYYASLTIAKDKFKLFDYVEGGQRTMPEDFATKNQKGTFDVTKKYNSNIGIQQPSSPRFDKHLYVLIDGGCFSTTSEFLSQVYANTNAEFIGEESGGNYYTNNSGIMAEVILPNSQLHVNIPMLQYTMAVPAEYPYKNHGIIPQHPVHPSVSDLTKNIDADMNYAIKLIKDRKQ